VTHLGASAGAFAWMFAEWSRYGKPSVLGIVTGMVAGLGTITPASGFVGPLGAVVIGAAAGVVCFFATQFLKRKLEIDDSLDVSPVHGVGGVIGTLLTGVFGAVALGGAGYPVQKTMLAQVGVQALGVIVAILWCALVTWLILKLVGAIVGLRVSEEQETEGLDLALHGERSYTA
jgi:Amt family ammonium transporter